MDKDYFLEHESWGYVLVIKDQSFENKRQCFIWSRFGD